MEVDFFPFQHLLLVLLLVLLSLLLQFVVELTMS